MTLIKNKLPFLLFFALMISVSASAQTDQEVQLHKAQLLEIWQETHYHEEIKKLSDIDEIYDILPPQYLLKISLNDLRTCLEHRAENDRKNQLVRQRYAKYESVRQRIRNASQAELDEIMGNPDAETKAYFEEEFNYIIPTIDTKDERGKHCIQLAKVIRAFQEAEEKD